MLVFLFIFRQLLLPLNLFLHLHCQYLLSLICFRHCFEHLLFFHLLYVLRILKNLFHLFSFDLTLFFSFLYLLRSQSFKLHPLLLLLILPLCKHRPLLLYGRLRLIFRQLDLHLFSPPFIKTHFLSFPSLHFPKLHPHLLPFFHILPPLGHRLLLLFLFPFVFYLLFFHLLFSLFFA